MDAKLISPVPYLLPLLNHRLPQHKLFPTLTRLKCPPPLRLYRR